MGVPGRPWRNTKIKVYGRKKKKHVWGTKISVWFALTEPPAFLGRVLVLSYCPRIIINNTLLHLQVLFFSGQSTIGLPKYDQNVWSVVRRSKKWGWRGGQSAAEARGQQGTTKAFGQGNATMRLHWEGYVNNGLGGRSEEGNIHGKEEKWSEANDF